MKAGRLQLGGCWLVPGGRRVLKGSGSDDLVKGGGGGGGGGEGLLVTPPGPRRPENPSNRTLSSGGRDGPLKEGRVSVGRNILRSIC